MLEHIRDVWVLHGIERNCVAGLYRTTFGIELRLHLGDELIESRLSRYGEAPLLLRAEQAEQNLLKEGWCLARETLRRFEYRDVMDFATCANRNAE